MPQVIFKSSDGALEEASADAPDGGALGDLCDASLSPVPFSCRSATCGTCRIVVLEGAIHLLDADDEELALLDVFGVDTAKSPLLQRLACQAKIRAGEGRLVIRPVADDEP
jgi:ferredoxin